MALQQQAQLAQLCSCEQVAESRGPLVLLQPGNCWRQPGGQAVEDAFSTEKNTSVVATIGTKSGRQAAAAPNPAVPPLLQLLCRSSICNFEACGWF